VVRQGNGAGRWGEVAVRVRCRDGRPHRVQVGGRVVPLLEGRLIGM
jgi:predicted PhzF superfamily epimerase YddE/YHI9